MTLMPPRPVAQRKSLQMARPATRGKQAKTPKFGFVRDLLLWSGKSERRYSRYFLSFGLPILALWAVVGLYVGLTPKSYVSEMTLNLPGATVSSNLSVDSIGQASSSAGNPFSSAAMSPKVIYKAIAESPRVRGMASKLVGDTGGMLAKPQIKLIDETAIMQFLVTANSPERARRDATALLQAMQQYLDQLRRDEVDRRADAIRQSLKDVSTNLDSARQKLLDFQKSAQIVSLDQFKAQIANSELNSQKLVELRAERDRLASESESLSTLLGVSAQEATLALKVQGDPRFAALSAELSLALTEDAANRGKWGNNHPKVKASSARLAAAKQALVKLSSQQAGKAGKRIAQHLLLSDSKDRAELFRKMVEYQAASLGITGQIKTLEAGGIATRQDLKLQSAHAAELEDLERDHKIAEAVFSSALARVDTNRQDIYASYPLLQVLSDPSLPQKASSPKIYFAIGGGIIGTLLILCALVLAWIRQPILRKLLKNF